MFFLHFSFLIDLYLFPFILFQRDHIIDNHKQRRLHLSTLIETARTQMSDHDTGRKLMESEEYEKVAKRILLYQQKLERMPEEPDEKVREDFKGHIYNFICHCTSFILILPSLFLTPGYQADYGS